MDTVSQGNRTDIASRILQAWGLNADQSARILNNSEHVIAVLSIYDSLQAIFSDESERTIQWPAEPNTAFDGASAVELMLAGDVEKVRSYLRYHVYNS